jgi:cell division transport system permease protein
VNTDSIANRALIAVIAIMTFLSALAGGAASMIRSASHDWSAEISNEITIQIKPVSGRNILNDQVRAAEIASTFRGLERVTPLSKAESSELLRPWLGAGFETGDLPIPQLITARVNRKELLDVAALSATLKVELPSAIVDDHRVWKDRLEKMSDGLTAIAFLVLFLFVLAMGLAVSFATRGAMAGSRDIVDVLHFVGASDKFIAREFQRHFLKLGMIGAIIGSSFALFLMWAMEPISQSFSTPSAEQAEALFGRMEIKSGVILILMLVTLLMAGVTSTISRVVATNQLKKIM